MSQAQTVTIDLNTSYQTIDGFGTCLGDSEPTNAWWQNLYFEDLQASMVRIDITPAFTSEYTTETYCSPWYGNSGDLNIQAGAGPAGDNTRPYTNATSYTSVFGGCTPKIAVMGPDIDANIAYFDFTAKSTLGLVAQLGQMKAAELGGFKLYASMWSPAPWVKKSSGNLYGGPYAGNLPLQNTPWPFIWGGNFAGGTLDVSGDALSIFNDGVQDTSALTQFARGLAAFLRGFQNTYKVTFYAISIQNELNFEEFYNSATYPLAAEYIAALKAARAELDQYDDLKSIKIIGPEDLLGGGPYALWQYGSGATEVDKNLHYLQAIAADATAESAIAGFAIHGYAPDGVSSAGADPAEWNSWANGWGASPGGGIPANVAGFTQYAKPSWMTETSGELPEWKAATVDGGFPDEGAFSIALKIHQALTTGMESAWLYWQLTDGTASSDSSTQNLTDATLQENGPKYVAVKHFFRYIRPGAKRVATSIQGSSNLLSSAYWNDANSSLTLVLINEGTTAVTATVDVPSAAYDVPSFSIYTSSSGSLWQPSTQAPSGHSLSIPMPAYGVATLYGVVATEMDAGVDAGMLDAGALDAGTIGTLDAGTHDAGTIGTIDAGMGGGPVDAGSHDAGVTDAGVTDAGVTDAGVTDAGVTDAGVTDAGVTDAGVTDAGVTDAGVTDAGVTDAGVTDAGVTDAGGVFGPGGSDGGETLSVPAASGCSSNGSPDAAMLSFFFASLFWHRSKKEKSARGS